MAPVRMHKSADGPRVLVAVVLLLVAQVGLVVWSLSGLRAVLVHLADRASPLVPGSPSPARTVRAVGVADNRLPGNRTCLMRSLTSETLLRLYGYDPTHRIGVDKAGDDVEAHSWIEHDGEVLIGGQGDLSRFEPLPPLDERDRP